MFTESALYMTQLFFKIFLTIFTQPQLKFYNFSRECSTDIWWCHSFFKISKTSYGLSLLGWFIPFLLLLLFVSLLESCVSFLSVSLRRFTSPSVTPVHCTFLWRSGRIHLTSSSHRRFRRIPLHFLSLPKGLTSPVFRTAEVQISSPWLFRFHSLWNHSLWIWLDLIFESFLQSVSLGWGVQTTSV